MILFVFSCNHGAENRIYRGGVMVTRAKPLCPLVTLAELGTVLFIDAFES